MTLLQAFQRFQWDAEPTRLGNHDLLIHVVETPTTCDKWLTKCTQNQYLLHTTAEDSFDERVAVCIFDAIENIDFASIPRNSVTVVPVEFPAPYQFDRIVVVPPEAGRMGHFGEFQRHSFGAYPAYASEFSHGMSLRDFASQFTRKDGFRVYLFRWNRQEKKMEKMSGSD
jgi:hypothetical protein